MTRATSVMIQLMESIMTSTPTTVTAGRDGLGDALVEALAQGVHVVGDAREGVAGGGLLEISEGHAVDLLGDGVGAAGSTVLLRDRQLMTQACTHEQAADSRYRASVAQQDAARWRRGS